jgi:hypothetical protein
LEKQTLDNLLVLDGNIGLPTDNFEDVSIIFLNLGICRLNSFIFKTQIFRMVIQCFFRHFKIIIEAAIGIYQSGYLKFQLRFPYTTVKDVYGA